MSHVYHELPRVVLGDDCEACLRRAKTIEGLAGLDTQNLQTLAGLAYVMNLGPEGGFYDSAKVSDSDRRAVDNLRLAARIVFASGITEETAR